MNCTPKVLRPTLRVPYFKPLCSTSLFQPPSFPPPLRSGMKKIIAGKDVFPDLFRLLCSL
ncbi:hypothetical protein JCM10003_3869 [Bacteroides pyogenes JCM 10003]|nr:hypothetical protein JCM10003_3869 [Bacteroides pyogenes JCM 10003]